MKARIILTTFWTLIFICSFIIFSSCVKVDEIKPDIEKVEARKERGITIK